MEQYGYVWSFSRVQFEHFLEVAAVGEYDLDAVGGRRLRGPGEHGEWSGGRIEGQDNRPVRFRNRVLISPLDWPREQFAETLAEIRAGTYWQLPNKYAEES